MERVSISWCHIVLDWDSYSLCIPHEAAESPLKLKLLNGMCSTTIGGVSVLSCLLPIRRQG